MVVEQQGAGGKADSMAVSAIDIDVKVVRRASTSAQSGRWAGCARKTHADGLRRAGAAG